MANQFESLLEATQLTDHKGISRAQLPILLAKVNGLRFTQLLLEWFGLVLDEDQKHWFSLDGKELRGSIQTGHTRGEVCVSALAHQTKQMVAQCFYNGSKESERSAVNHLLEQGQGFLIKKIPCVFGGELSDFALDLVLKIQLRMRN